MERRGALSWARCLLSGLCFCSAFVLPGGSSAPAARIEDPAVGQFWHVTDLHLDPTYHITEDHTKVCSSSKGENASNPGLFGDFECDAPYQLILSALEFINSSGQEASFMIWTGDSPPHIPVEELSTDIVIDILGNLTTTIRSLFPNFPVYPALGNHDYWPKDQLPVSTSKVYEAVANFWKPWLSEEAIQTLRTGGFYSQIVPSHLSSQPLRIISLNTNLYYSPNAVTINETDPANQLEWLEHTLNSSRHNKEKVYVIAHIPVGYVQFSRNITAMREYYNEKLVGIFLEYSDIIEGQFYGHTHRDSLMVLSDREGNPVGSLFVAPAVTPQKFNLLKKTNNPGVRLYQYDLHDFHLLDIWQYYLNLTEANMEEEPIWKLEYILTEAYGIEDLQPRNLYELAKQFEILDNEQFLTYYNYFHVSYDSNVTCSRECKTDKICAIMNLDQASYIDCLKQYGV